MLRIAALIALLHTTNSFSITCNPYHTFPRTEIDNENKVAPQRCFLKEKEPIADVTFEALRCEMATFPLQSYFYVPPKPNPDRAFMTDAKHVVNPKINTYEIRNPPNKDKKLITFCSNYKCITLPFLTGNFHFYMATKNAPCPSINLLHIYHRHSSDEFVCIIQLESISTEYPLSIKITPQDHITHLLYSISGTHPRPNFSVHLFYSSTTSKTKNSTSSNAEDSSDLNETEISQQDEKLQIQEYLFKSNLSNEIRVGEFVASESYSVHMDGIKQGIHEHKFKVADASSLINAEGLISFKIHTGIRGFERNSSDLATIDTQAQRYGVRTSYFPPHDLEMDEYADSYLPHMVLELVLDSARSLSNHIESRRIMNLKDWKRVKAHYSSSLLEENEKNEESDDSEESAEDDAPNVTEAANNNPQRLMNIHEVVAKEINTFSVPETQEADAIMRKHSALVSDFERDFPVVGDTPNFYVGLANKDQDKNGKDSGSAQNPKSQEEVDKLNQELKAREKAQEKANNAATGEKTNAQQTEKKPKKRTTLSRYLEPGIWAFVLAVIATAFSITFLINYLNKNKAKRASTH